MKPKIAKTLFFFVLWVINLYGFCQTSLNEVKRLIENENYTQAIDMCNQLLADSKDGKAYYYKALAYYYLSADGHISPAERSSYHNNVKQTANEAIAKSKKAPFANLALGLAAFVSDNPTEAKNQIDQAIEKAPQDVSLLIEVTRTYQEAYNMEIAKPNKGNTQTKKLAIDNATTAITKAETYDKKNPEIYITIGDLYRLQNIEELPENNYKKAIALNPTNAQAQYALGNYLVKKKKYKDAEQVLTKVIELDPKFAPAYKDLSDIYYNIAGEDKRIYKKSLEYATKWRDLLGNDKRAKTRYATLLYLIGLYSDAVPAFEEVLKDTSNFVLERLYGYCLIEDKKYPEGKKQMDKYFAMIKPQDYVFKDYKYYGMALENTGEADRAIEYYQKAIDADQSLSTLNKNIAEIYKKKEDWQNYTKYLEKYVEKNSNLGDEFYLGFYYYQKLKEYEKAEAKFNKIKAAKPEFIETHYYLALVAEKQDTSGAKSVPHFETMMKQIYKQNQQEDPNKKKWLSEAANKLTFYYYKKNDYPRAYGFANIAITNTATTESNKKNLQAVIDYVKSKNAQPLDIEAELKQ